MYMQELDDFSIETDNIILLQYKDGARQRVQVKELSQHLSKRDLQKVNAALKLRRSFIKTHMPRMGALLVMTGLLAAVMITGGPVVSHWLVRPGAPQSVTAPGDTVKAGSLAAPSPVSTPPANETAAPAATPLATTPSPAPVATTAPAKATAPVTDIITRPIQTVTHAIGGLLDAVQ
jgi:hypothetical protein